MTTTPALLATRDDALLDDVLRLAAAAGLPVDVAPDPDSALRGWAAAPVVLLGADLAPALAARTPPRRERVHVVTRPPLEDRVFREALEVGARDVVELPAAESWLAEVLADAADGSGTSSAPVVGVVAGSGGAGASTFAGALAVVAAASYPVVLVDLDPWGAGLDRVIGVDQGAGVRWEALAEGRGRLGSRSLRAALPGRGGVGVLTWGPPRGTAPSPPPTAVTLEVLAAARRGTGLVVLDLPRSLTGAAAEAAARCSRLLVLCEATVGSVLAAGKVAQRALALHQDVGVVVRGAGPGVGADRVAAALRLPLLAAYPARRTVAEQVELGLGPVHGRRSAMARAAAEVLGELGTGLR